jgi:serine/threonine protein kinase
MLLGKGAFGMVYQALLSTGAIIAVKQVEMEESDPVKALKEYENIKEEVNILKELDHENIVK